MTLFQSILLGIIQGLTEFLPISSSGHLVIVPHLLGWDIPGDEAFVFNVLVQVATIIAVIAYFWKDLVTILSAVFSGLARRTLLANPQARLGWMIVAATIPAGLVGLLIKDLVEQAFSSLLATGIFLLVTAGLLTIAERMGKRQRELDSLKLSDAVWIGVAQAAAIFPGVSRSGATITGGMLRGLQRPAAARFSFLMSIPIMLAAGLLAFLDLLEMPNIGRLLPVFIPGFLAAGVTGYFAIRWLLGYLTRKPLTIFSIYCLALGLLSIGVSLFG
ncbi:MAG TPA: undecaprenyl-diphosphatase UppP [Anaerolineales bacterium]|nr:undecaprenyl-diphosphatase UppP [Anaerolineales bacterium]